jgi:hypothetical protein
MALGPGPLSPLARKFLRRFVQEFPMVTRDEEPIDTGFLRIPAVHPKVGDLQVWDDEEELTIGVGEHHHNHYSLYMYSDLPSSEAEDRVVEDALSFLRELFAHQVVLGLSWDGTRLKWSHTYHLGEDEKATFQGAAGYEEYFWTGPRLQK